MQQPTTNHPFYIPEPILELSENVHKLGGQTIIVGGTVRDYMLGLEAKDFDLEIHSLSSKKIEDLLKGVAKFKRVGKSFPVWKCRFPSLPEIDIALPCGEDGVEQPFLGFEQAAKRRDFRFNSMGYDIKTQEILDPLNGKKDISDLVIRMTDPKQMFHDPLRLFRGVELAARFGFALEPAIIEIAQDINIADLPRERVRVEIEKIFINSTSPDIGLQYSYDLMLWQRYLPKLNLERWSNIADGVKQLHKNCTPDRNQFRLLYWAMLLSDTNLEARRDILDKMGIVNAPAQEINDICLNWGRLTLPCSSIQLNHLAEAYSISKMALIARSRHPELEEVIYDNLEAARKSNIHESPLPALVTGGELFQRGFRGKQISTTLNQLRLQQLDENISTTEQAFQFISTVIPSAN